MKQSSPPDELATPPSSSGEILDPLVSIRSILLTDVSKHIGELEREMESLYRQAQLENEDLRQQLSNLLTELEKIRALAREADNRARDIVPELELLRRKAQANSEGLIARITPVLGDMIGRSIRDLRDEMAEALGPIMGEAIRVQIRDSRKDMIEALYPVIGETVQRAISEFTKEFQRNIDARLRASFGPQGIIRTAMARLRGITPSQLAMRDSLPFTIKEIFLIQHKSGLLIAHTHPGSAEIEDSDLISAMLTAIRDFVHDAFGQGQEDKELDEVQYGDEHIIIQSGRVTYLAVVTQGVEPEGFRARLHKFMSELEVKYERVLRQYNGDPSILPNLQPKIAHLIAETTEGKTAPRPISRKTKLALAGGSIIGLLLIALACFYLRFTMALYPIAFPSPTPTNTSTPTPTSTATSTPTFTPTSTDTPTPTSTSTPTPTNTSTPTPTFTFTPTPTPYTAIASGNVWVRKDPTFYNSPRWMVLFNNTPVKVLSAYGSWTEIEWQSENGIQHGWVPAQWIALLQPIPAELITPTSTP